MTLVIDSHQHFWQLTEPFDHGWLAAPDKSAIRRDFMPDDLEPLLREAGVERTKSPSLTRRASSLGARRVSEGAVVHTILVQTQHNLAENRWALRLAERHPFIAGVVGWIDLANPDCQRQLAEFEHHPKFVGVRHLTQDEPDDDFLVRPEVIRGLRVLENHRVPFDLLLYVKHLRHVPALARELPELPMVIDHLAKPNIREKRFAEWLPDFRAAGVFPNVFCKLSGMITEADWRRWKADDLKPYVQAALEVFGPNRCMFGSDWPVCTLAGTYGDVKQALIDALGPLTADERDAIFGGTAQKFYGVI
jgi:L-fuconolactonase